MNYKGQPVILPEGIPLIGSIFLPPIRIVILFSGKRYSTCIINESNLCSIYFLYFCRLIK